MIQAVCTSHSPLLLHVEPENQQDAGAFYGAIEQAHEAIAAYDPELVVVFGPDHFNGFFYNAMPQFCVGLEAESTHDWGIDFGSLEVPRQIARGLSEAVLEAGIDIAVSYKMKVDHGFTIALKLLTKRLDAYPTIPVFINCNATPRASCRRARLLGTAVGQYLSRLDKRALVIGSGGLSHDPPHPAYEKAPPNVQQFLVGSVPWGQDIERTRQDRVMSAARDMKNGHSSILPPNREWDRRVLDALLRHRLDEVDSFRDDWISAEGGSGGHEIRTWVAAFAALSSQGTYRSELLYYDIVPDWVTGMAVARGYL